MSEQDRQTVAGLSHVAIRTRDILESVRFYTEVLGLREAFRMHREDGTLATVYMFIAPGQYLELFSGGTREGEAGKDVIGFCPQIEMMEMPPESLQAQADRRFSERSGND